jgi:hypothetical protein
VSGYFEHLPALVEHFPLEVCLAYMFAQVELAQNMTLYHGVRKLHSAHAEVARNAVNVHHLTRAGFESLFKNVFGRALPGPVLTPLKNAEKVRDLVMHGKAATNEAKRGAIVEVLDYASKHNAFVDKHAGFKPFKKDLRGVTGAAKSLEKSTTKWMLMGMGFTLS